MFRTREAEMNDLIKERFDSLLSLGKQFVEKLPRNEYSYDYYLRETDIPNAESWILSVSNLIRTISDNKSHYVEECNKILDHEHIQNGIPCVVIQKLQGLLTSVSVEWENGLLRKIEYIISAARFDDFLDHATIYHKGNKKIEASVLASTVLEDSIKKIARKHEIESQGKSLEELIDQLVKDCVLTQVKAKRIKSHAGVRNHALHAEWDKFDIKDVGELIKGTRDLLENYL